MSRLIVCRNCTESDCTYCNINILAVALERGYFNSLMREQHTAQIDSELVPVRHGHWTPHPATENREWDVCSSCGIGCKRREYGDGWETQYNYPFCPNCGAKMDEVTDDNA